MMEEQIIDYIMDNREHFKLRYDELLEERDQWLKEESSLFHDDIIEEMDDLVVSEISEEISKSLGCDYESIIMVLEDINLKNLLN